MLEFMNGRINPHKVHFMKLNLFILFTFISQYAFLFSQSINKEVSGKDELIIHPSEFTSSNLPIIVIDTHNQAIPDEDKILIDLGIIFNGEGERNSYPGEFNHYNGNAGIELRGSSSLMFPKKSYALETRDSSGENFDVSILGMPEENDWILYAPYSDKSLLRNVIAYKLANEMGHYATRTNFCELVINGEYQGIYVLMEKIKRDKNRVNIKKLDPEDSSGVKLTGGYLIKIDKTAGENNAGWYSPFLPYSQAHQKILYQYHDPSPDEIVEPQKKYIQDYVFKFESLMNSSLYNDPVVGYSTYIDVNSFIDYFLFTELVKNVDGYRLSMFMYKDRDSEDSRLKMGPYWDYNLAFGNADYYNASKTDGLQIDYFSNNYDFLNTDEYQVPFWWKKLVKDSNFKSKAEARWNELKSNLFNKDKIFGFIDSLTEYLQEARIRNFEKWPVIGTYVWPNAFIGNSYAEEIDYFKSWINSRINWLNNNIITSVEEVNIKPTGFTELYQNYPNPFNPVTKIKFTIGNNSGKIVQLIIYDILGREVKVLVNEILSAGIYEVEFNGTGIPSGVYFYKLTAGSLTIENKMLLLK